MFSVCVLLPPVGLQACRACVCALHIYDIQNANSKRGVSAGHNVGPLMSRHMSPTGQGKTPCSHACSCVQDIARLRVFCMSRDTSIKTRNEDYHSTCLRVFLHEIQSSGFPNGHVASAEAKNGLFLPFAFLFFRFLLSSQREHR